MMHLKTLSRESENTRAIPANKKPYGFLDDGKNWYEEQKNFSQTPLKWSMT
ncbi:hypothetical protein JE86ST02C_680 (plasmid) [Escherichia coli]|nr:hypothetical protein JE86ST02C_680 [Escherichia coli]